MIQRIARLQFRLLDRARHKEAFRAAAEPPRASGFAALDGHHYCLLVSFRRSGEPVPTPVLFGLRDGRLYLRTDATTAKVARIRNDSRVLVGPSDARGKPHGPLAPGTARVMSPEEHEDAYAVLKGNYTPVQRAGERMLDVLPIDIAYIEVTPARGAAG
jgi:PPOX class probable F420-dependent enzyme